MASGAHGAVIGSFNPIDHAAALLVALEAGAVVLDAEGVETPWPATGSPFVVAAPPVVAQSLTEIVRNAVREHRARATV